MVLELLEFYKQPSGPILGSAAGERQKLLLGEAQHCVAGQVVAQREAGKAHKRLPHALALESKPASGLCGCGAGQWRAICWASLAAARTSHTIQL